MELFNIYIQLREQIIASSLFLSLFTQQNSTRFWTLAISRLLFLLISTSSFDCSFIHSRKTNLFSNLFGHHFILFFYFFLLYLFTFLLLVVSFHCVNTESWARLAWEDSQLTGSSSDRPNPMTKRAIAVVDEDAHVTVPIRVPIDFVANQKNNFIFLFTIKCFLIIIKFLKNSMIQKERWKR